MHTGLTRCPPAWRPRGVARRGRTAAGSVFVGLLIAVCVGVCRAERLGFTAALDQDTTTVGEPVTLSLTFEGAQPTRVYGLPQVAGLVFQGRGSTMETDIVNGQTTTKFIYLYAVTPQREGTFTIPAVRAEVGGRVLESTPLTLRVLQSEQAPNGNGLSRFAFLKLLVQKTNVYVGQVFPVDIWLYVQSGQDLEMPQINGDGFTFGPMAKPAQTQRQLGNTVYNLVRFKLTATAVKTGTLALGPAQCGLTLRLPAGRPRPDAFGFDPFNFFGSPYQLRRVTLTSATEAIHVLPLPGSHVPASFNGAIGNFTVSLQAGPTNVAVGDPITLRVSIAGHGNLATLNLPTEAWPGFKTYPPTSKIVTTDPLGLQGVKTFEEVVVPQRPDLKALPTFSFSFFDPEQKSYRTQTLPATPVVVRPSAPTPPPLLAGAGNASTATGETQEIVTQRQHLGSVAAIGPPLIERPWFLALQGVPTLAWLSVLVWRRRQDQLANNPRLRRQREVNRAVREGLAELRRLADTNDAEGFFVTVFRLLQEQIGQRADLPASAITEAVLEERLRPLGVAEETLAALRDLLQLCDQARYAPVRSTQELLAWLPKVEAALRDLRNGS